MEVARPARDCDSVASRQTQPRRYSMRLRVLSVLVAMLLPLVMFFSGPARAQTDSVPSVRGTLYESPSFGWILLVPRPAWEVDSAESEGGHDTVHLVSPPLGTAPTHFSSRPETMAVARLAVSTTCWQALPLPTRVSLAGLV